ncbi:MAG: peptidase lipoprotein family [Phycisphaerales bacterium]|nr:peptidase lipoprotein family [Phycisphaerales bacterium]
MKLLPSLSLAAALLLTASGCTIEPFADPIPIPAGYVPASYAQPVYIPAAAVTTSPRTTSPQISTTAPEAQPVIDDKIRDQVLAATQAAIVKRFGIDPNPQLNEYLILVGSLVTINTPRPDADYAYLLLNTDQPISCALWPRTICVSRGLFAQMQDESELAGVIAREISNLISARSVKLAGLPVPSEPTTRPVTQPITAAPPTPLVTRLAAKLTDILLKDGFGPELDQAADIEAAQFAAAAKYAPDGLLRLLTRQKPDARATTTTQAAQAWQRIQALNANVQIVAKAYPHSEARLPARFETYLKPIAPASAANP